MNNRGPYEFRGASLEMLQSSDLEVMLSGAAGTGKSVACLAKLHICCEMVPGMRALIVRKTRESLTESGLVTFEERVVPAMHPILATGGQRKMRQSYRYPNGSQITVGGMDKPSKVMSTEYDLIYVQEAIELREGDWEALITRLRNGKLPYQQIFGDTNPDAPTHWIKRRQRDGKLRLLDSKHQDNPAWYQPGKGWSEAGKRYLAKLASLTGLRRLRLEKGLWVQAEGVIYEEFDAQLHLIDRFEIPLEWERLWSVDFGYTNPFVCSFWAKDHDGRLYRYREIYHTRRIVADHAKTIQRVFAEEVDFWAGKKGYPRTAIEDRLRPRVVLCDHDAEDRATLSKELGISTVASPKVVKPGIEAVQLRLRVAGDGKPRVFFLRDSLVERDPDLEEAKKPTCTEEEFGAYVWQEGKEEPVKENDHGMDAMRYLIYASDSGFVWESPSFAGQPTASEVSAKEKERLASIYRHGQTDRPSRMFGR